MESPEKHTFIFVWKIENLIHYVHDEIYSPVFFAHSIESEFRLKLLFRKQEYGESIISLYLELLQSYPPSIELDFELSFLGMDGLPLICKEKLKKSFEKDKQRGFRDFMPLSDLIRSRNEFLPQGTLTVQCKMWTSDSSMTESVVCFAQTVIGIEQLSFVWPIERFSSVRCGGSAPYSVRTASGEDLVLSMNFQLESVSPTAMQFEIELTPGNVHQITGKEGENYTGGETGFYDFKFSFVNSSGEEKLDQEITRLESHRIRKLQVLITEQFLDANSGYLVDDVLLLKCRFTFYEGIVSAKIENTVYGSCAVSDFSDSRTVLRYDGVNTCLSSMKDLHKFLYETKMFCDLSLRTGTETFSVHKSVLASKSPVFQSMFEENGKKNAVFEVTDVNAETLSQLILYIYTDAVNDKQLENVYQLFLAAKKYKILALKNRCFLILANNITIHNACEMLCFADKHEEHSLKSTVQDFIREHRSEITGSTAWKILEKRNADLTEEINLV